MKNQEAILGIKRDIESLKDLIRLREARIELAKDNKLEEVFLKRIARDQKEIAELEKVIKKLEQEDAKTWKEALAIAHSGKLKEWWIENWAWIWIGFLIVVSSIIFVLIITGGK